MKHLKCIEFILLDGLIFLFVITWNISNPIIIIFIEINLNFISHLNN